MEDKDRADAGLDGTVMRRLHRALTAGKEELFQLVDDPAMEVLAALLKNPSLDEHHLLQLLKRRDLSEELLRTVYRSRLAEESHVVKVALVKNPGTPAPLTLALLPHLYLFELVAICYLPGVTPDQKLAAERAIIQRLPTAPLGTKMTLARRGTAPVVEAILQEGDLPLMEPCLGNPRLKEAAVFRFISGPKAKAETISAVARHPKWKTRPNLRLAILKNSRTPLVWYTLFLPGLSPADLKSLLLSRRLTPPQLKLVHEEGAKQGLMVRSR